MDVSGVKAAQLVPLLAGLCYSLTGWFWRFRSGEVQVQALDTDGGERALDVALDDRDYVLPVARVVPRVVLRRVELVGLHPLVVHE